MAQVKKKAARNKATPPADRPAGPGFVSGAALADILGITPQRVGQLVREGMPKKARGKYDIGEAVRWYIDKWRNRDKVGDSDLAKERLKLYQSQRVKTDLENETTRRELISSDEVALVLNELAAIYSSQLDALGGRLANELAGMTEAAEILLKLTDEARAIRDVVAGKIDAFADTLDNRKHNSAAA